MNKSSIIIVISTAIVFLTIGYFSQGFLSGLGQNSYLSDQIKKYSDDSLGMEVCENFEIGQQKLCAYSALERAAYQKNSKTYCEDIDNQVVRGSCILRVDATNKLRNSDAGNLCTGFESYPICIDLALFLQSQILSDSSYCLNLNDERLRGLCYVLLGQEDFSSNNQNHPLGAVEGSIKALFNEAIASSDPLLCQFFLGNELQVQLCIDEIDLHQKVLSGAIELCQGDVACQIAVASNGVDLCGQISDASAVDLCNRVVNKEITGRFDYLK